MDVSKPGEDGSQFQASWMPTTPVKPTLQRPEPIHADGQANQLAQAKWSESETYSPGRIVECYYSLSSGEVTRGGVGNWMELPAGKSSIDTDNAGTNDETMARWDNLSFGQLLALADAASAQSNYNVATSSFMSVAPGQNESSREDYLSASQESGLGNNDCYVPEQPYYVGSPHQQSYDLNLPPQTMCDMDSSLNILQLMSITTEDMRVQNELISEEQNSCAMQRIDEEREKLETEVAATGIDNNEVQCNNISKPATDSSFDAVITPFMENHNPDKGCGHSIDLNKTPQHKPKRKKHRPRVVTEGKPKRAPKPVAPKPTVKEHPTVKRKYVRRKGINKSSATPSGELTRESTDPKILEPSRKSCRRALKFGIGQAQDECSTCKTSINLDSEIQFPIGSKEHATGMRKYTRRKVINKPSATNPAELGEAELGEESTDLPTVEPGRKSRRRALKFDKGQPQDESSTCKSSINFGSELQVQDFCKEVPSGLTVQLGERNAVIVEHTEAGTADNIACSTNEKLKEYISFPEGKAPRSSVQTKDSPQAKPDADSQKDSPGEGQLVAHEGLEKIAKVISNTDNQVLLNSPTEANWGTSTILPKGAKASRSKRRGAKAAKPADNHIPNFVGAHFSTLDAHQMNWIHFPNIKKKKRTEKDQNCSTSSSSSCITAARNIERLAAWLQHEVEANPFLPKAGHQFPGLSQLDAGMVSQTVEDKERDLQSSLQNVERIATSIQKNRSSRKRSKATSLIHDLTSLTTVFKCITHPTEQHTAVDSGQIVENLHKPHTCTDGLTAKMCATPAKRKRTKRKTSFLTSAPFSASEMQLDQELVLYNHHLPSSTNSGASMDALVEQFNHLHINKESRKQHYAVVPYSMQNQEQNALILYERDGTVVPYGAWFDSTKKRRPRPKVDLDEETNKVWRLLMENISSEGIDGADEEKAKWWEEERRVFHGRADSFVARMRLVQGDRRFSQWKGSVVDSVVGVFLTQNVSDHLSSSAFMSLAAHFPLKSRSNHKACDEDRASFVVTEPEACILEPWKPDSEQSSVMLQDIEHNEEKELVNSNAPPGGIMAGYIEEDGMATNDPVSSQNSAFSSENLSFTRTAVKIGLCPKADCLLNGSKPNIGNAFVSRVGLQQMDESTMENRVNNHGSTNASSNESPKDASSKSKGMNHDNQRQNIDKVNDLQSSLGATMSPSNNYPSHPNPPSRALDVEPSEILKEIQYLNSSQDEDTTSKQSTLTTESSSSAYVPNELTMSTKRSSRSSSVLCNNFQGNENVVISSQNQALGDPKIVDPPTQGQNKEMQQYSSNLSGETVDVTQTTAESNLNAHGHLSSVEINETKSTTVQAKSKRVQKEKKDKIRWDSLREQVESNGKKRERTANTMDSLDWEAVRSADVKEIANTIKERGMNNMLAERIKDFLNRLVREHGSIDLEWLRDVPPDQAKEYLLSIRGLGLKSVECVRLLTLHHLAFPVDTNVGRIAVRLGWVPLQPLPESLQLHLLELYPVLESIQKYLWPRLCKLDQRSLYELHYQLITFGKVFCTKSKPNCNSCPMRGECRHFASAFASARLALPGPEEKSIVSTTGYRPDEKHNVISNQLVLPLPQSQSEEDQQPEASAQSKSISGVTNCEPIIEEPATPEPETKQLEIDIEDTSYEDPNEIPVIKLNIDEFTHTLHTYMQNNMELQEYDMSKALVALTPEAASIPMPKLKNVSRLRTEHLVYELPDSHPLLQGVDRREPDDPCSYLLAIWTPGETANSIQPPGKRCNSHEYGKFCEKEECFSCNSVREANSQMVRATLLIPCRTAMRGSFPLNGTYFQVNEVFADHDSSITPIDVPRDWIWNLPRRTVYFGTSIPTIFKGLSTEGIQHCFWRGYVCVRGFDQKTRAPRPLLARLHFPASKLTRTKGTTEDK